LNWWVQARPTKNCKFAIQQLEIEALNSLVFGGVYKWSMLDRFVILVGTCDLRTLWSPPVSLNRIYFERDHTQRRKAVNFNFNFILFCGENLLKSPPWKTYGEASILENFQKKKTKLPHFQEGEKKKFWNLHILRRKKTGF
jgi:hypothetical protein